MNIEISKKMVRRIISIMADYFDADTLNVSMSADDKSEGRISISATMYSEEEASYRSAWLNVTDGIITIGVDYLVPDSPTKVRLWELVFIGRTVSKFKPLTMDVAFPDELIRDIATVFNNEGGTLNV